MMSLVAFSSLRSALAGFVMTDSNIYTARDAWLANPTAAEATYGHISTWETAGVTDMSYLFCGPSFYRNCNSAAASFNEDISAWNTSGVTTMESMFNYASAFNQDIGDWAVHSITDMSTMFYYASAFDQDLGWCVGHENVDLHNTFRYSPCESTSCGILPAAALKCGGSPMGDFGIRLAVTAWLSNSASAEARYGHISTWDTSRVRDMGHLFSRDYRGWSEFNEDISAWDTSSATTFTYMFYSASSFNRPISGWNVDKVTSMTDMFRGAEAFDQDLGWCLGDHVNFASAFEKTKCESTRCGVSQKDVIGNCERFARPCLIGTKQQCHINSPTLAFLLANILLALIASVEWYVHRRKEEDETYVAAARRLLCCRRCQSRMESSSATSPRPDSPAESPRDEPDEEAPAEKTKAAEPVELSSFSQKLTSFFFGEREKPEEEEADALPVVAEAEAPTEQPPRPPRTRRWFSGAEPEPAAAPKAEEETAAFPVLAEAEEEPTEQPPPPPPARRWFSSAEPEPEPAAPKAEDTYNRMADWYNEPKNAALRSTWGAFPAPDEFQTWPGFVAVTNAFLDREAGEPEA